ncbi:MAG: primosomal protein N' [Clostridia bacterium]|nr:primosomal protein N' [Clostridia bacterium]
MEQETVARYCGVHILDNPFSIDGVFHYYVPPYMADAVTPGAFVTVPFGRGNRKQLGVVVEVGDASSLPGKFSPDRIKPIDGVCREKLFLSPRQLSLCFYLKETTLCTMGEAVRTVVPASALASLTEFYTANPDDSRLESRRSTLPSPDLLVLDYIRARGTVSAQAVKNHFGVKAAASLDRLREKELLTRELTVRQPDVPTVTYYTLARPAEEIEASLRGDKGAVRVSSELQKKVLSALMAAEDRLSAPELREATGAGAPQLKSLADKGLIAATTEETYRTSPESEGFGVRTPFDLSDEQAEAVATLDGLAATGEPRAALLHGVTGSGKTCVILEMIDRTLGRGKGVIVLLPEISLTPQMLHIFHSRYGRRVAIIHSGLSAGERLDSYRRIRDGDAPIAVGTRSAVFAPMQNLGMIVMDEEQEHTYKSDQDPKYHARDIARYRCATENALLLLASATPSLESYQKAMDGKYTLISMKRRFGAARLPDVRIVDMRGEAGGGNLSPLGEELAGEVARVKDEGNQSVLFLNRRGYSHQTVCRSCGKAISCPRCSVAMNYHVKKDSHEGELVCHWCGGRKPVPTVCPDCGSVHLVRMGYGTQRVEEELRTAFPSARVLRMDADTTSRKSAYDRLLGAFRNHEADILLGTQMVTKGHDFPDVTLVGVLLADMSLYLDDYRAAERTFSMLTQVIGRAGRGDKPGLAVIQTMNPDSDVIRLACAQDYERFFQNEIRLRRLLQFPPFCDMVLLTLTCRDEKELQKASLRLSEQLKAKNLSDYRDVPIVAFGPFEAPVYRVDNIYRMRMVVKCRLNKRARAMFEELLISFASEGRGSNRPVLSIDFNPSSI